MCIRDSYYSTTSYFEKRQDFFICSTHRVNKDKCSAVSYTHLDVYKRQAMRRWAVSFRSSRRQCSRKAYSTVEAALLTPLRSEKLRMARGRCV